VALYMLDWDFGGRAERVDVLDANNNVLDTRSVSAFSGGVYLVWNLSGHVILRVTNTIPGGNAVLSGILFGAGNGGSPPPSTGTAAFVKSDTTAQGTWKSVYGTEGYNIINDTASYPA